MTPLPDLSKLAAFLDLCRAGLQKRALLLGQRIAPLGAHLQIIKPAARVIGHFPTPAVAQFCKNHPSIGVSLQIDADPFDMRRSPVDLRLSFHAHHDQGLAVRQLLRDSVAPVCAPGFAESVSEIKDAQLIHVDWGASYTSYPTWASWFRHFNIARYPDTSKGIRVAGTGVGIEMAAQGVGLLLAPLHLARSELSNGRLVRLETDQIDLPFGYYATQTSLRTKQGYIDALLQLLRER